jgi:hypothetical protein
MTFAALTSTTLAMFPSDAIEGEHVWRLSLDCFECADAESSLFEQTCIAIDGEHFLRMQTRRDSCSHFLLRLDGESGYVIAENAQQCVLYCARGELSLPDADVRLSSNQVHVLDEVLASQGIAFAWRATEGAEVYLVRISYFS